MPAPSPSTSRSRRGAAGARVALARLTAFRATAAFAAACAHARPGSTSPSGSAGVDSAKAASSAVGPIPVEIDNRSSLDAVVYVVRGSVRQRLGTVSAVSHLSAVIPATFTDDRGGVALLAYRLAGNTSFTTDRVVPQPGDRLVLTLQTRLNQSTLVVQ